MRKERLLTHYTEKYAHEADATVAITYRDTMCPANRFEAAIHFIKKGFRGGRILELGSGSGIVLRSLLAAGVDFDEYVVSDVSEPRLASIRRTIHDERDRVRTRVMDAECIGNEELGQYDLVIMVALIEHLIDPLGAMQGIRQLLTRRGMVYIDTPNIAKYSRRLKLLAGRFPSTASTNEGLTTYGGTKVDLYDEGHLHYFTYRSLSLMLTERCGFSRVEKHGYFQGSYVFPGRLFSALARGWPEMFSDVTLLAYA